MILRPSVLFDSTFETRGNKLEMVLLLLHAARYLMCSTENRECDDEKM